VNLSIVILIQKLQPVFAIILAALLLKERLPGTFFIWSGTAVAGAYLMTFGIQLPDFATGDKTVYAAGFALLAAFSFASSTVFSKRALRNISFEFGTYLRFLFTAVIMIIVVLSSGALPRIGEISEIQIYTFLIIAFTSGGLAIFLYYYGLKNISASVATIAELAFPLTAVLLEYFIRDNILDAVQWLGVLFLMIAIFRVTKVNMKTP
jgi:drug/metabolite transporter (DMT)-like permease